jgi:hypothetical protein
MGGGNSIAKVARTSDYTLMGTPNCSLNLLIKKDSIKEYEMVGGAIVQESDNSLCVTSRFVDIVRLWGFECQHGVPAIKVKGSNVSLAKPYMLTMNLRKSLSDVYQSYGNE